MEVLNQVIPIYLVSLKIYSNVSVHPFFLTHFIGIYFKYYNIIDNHNIMQQSILALEKYWVAHSGYFIFVTTVALGMGITDGKIIFYHGISEGSMEKQISMREYNNRTVYD